MVTKTVLHNGVRVVTEHIPHAHSVSIGIWVANGSRHESPPLNGVAHFIEHLLFKGTEQRSALDIAREIDSVGGVMNAFTSREYVCYYVKVLDRFLPKAVELLADIFLNSIFDPAEIEKERKVILQEIHMVEDNPDDCIHDLFVRNFWKDHPLGMSILGSLESVSSLDRDAIIAFKNEKYLANEIIISAAGNVIEQELVGLLNKLFVQVPAGAVAALCALPVYAKRLEIIERDIEQVHFCLGTRALPQNHPQRHEGHLLNTVLGGSMSSRLFQEVREKQGLAYSVYSYVSSYTDAGSMVVYAGTSPVHVEDVLDIVLRELKRLKTEPVPVIELNYAREQIKGNLLLSLESSDSRMTKLAKNEIYFGRNVAIEEIMASLDAVTSEGLLQLSNELFDDAYFTLELMGRVDGNSLVPDRVKL